LIRHTVVGVGEATFAAIAPAYIADLFPQERRGRMLSVFYIALPVGAALGYVIGGVLGSRFGWRAPFYVCAVPGMVVALLLFAVREPERGVQDRFKEDDRPNRNSLRMLMKNPAYMTATLGMAMYTFAIGGISAWMPTFLYRERGVPLEKAALIFGGITVVNGLLATVAGGWWGDAWMKRTPRAYYLLSAWSMALCCPVAVLSIYGPRGMMFAALCGAEFLLFLNTGPMNTAIVNSVSAKIRAGAVAVNLFIIHALGDAVSPWLMGRIADHASLAAGFVPAFVAIVVSAALLFFGARFAPLPQAAASASEAR